MRGVSARSFSRALILPLQSQKCVTVLIGWCPQQDARPCLWNLPEISITPESCRFRQLNYSSPALQVRQCRDGELEKGTKTWTPRWAMWSPALLPSNILLQFCNSHHHLTMFSFNTVKKKKRKLEDWSVGKKMAPAQYLILYKILFPWCQYNLLGS